MVTISKETVAQYPKFSAFILQEATEAMGNVKIPSAMLMSAFTTLQRLDPKQVLEIPKALCHGTRPEVIPSFTEKFRKDSSFFAEYDHLTQTIYINVTLVGLFESDPDLERRERVKAVVFHEIVHHLDFIADGQFQDYDIVGGKIIRKPEVTERGWYFEELAFGKIKSKDF